MADAGISLRQALSEMAQLLQSAGIDRARAEARLLVAHVLDASIETIIANDGRLLTPDELQRLRLLAAQRGERQPMSQVLGYREFFGRRFKVTPDVLTPRPDSETLIEAVLAQVRDRDAPLRLLELGLGSGCLLLTLLAELPKARGVGVEISPPALAVAQENAAALEVTERCRLVQGDWSAAADGQFDVLLSNPPYIPSAEIAGLEPEVSRYEPRLALDGNEDGLSFYRRIAADYERLLTRAGFVAVEVGQGQSGEVARLFEAVGLHILKTQQDLAGIERCVLATSA